MNGLDQSGVFDTDSIAEAIQSACIAELGALKPGNVSVYSEGHGMAVDDFLHSARAIAPVLSRKGLSVGESILAAIKATRQVVHCNTNLGIVLLCAPLAHAAINHRQGRSLRDALRETLLALDEKDTRLTYEAIRLAGPAGLGDVPQYDVHDDAPRITLLQAMRTAQQYDLIAQQYVNIYADVFEIALPYLYDGMDRWDSEEWAVVLTYLGLLSTHPDTHIVRKYGLRVAQNVSARAECMVDRLFEKQDTPQSMFASLMKFDSDLKQQGINPGTSADLTVAALTVKRLQDSFCNTGQEPIHGRGGRPGCCSSAVSSIAT